MLYTTLPKFTHYTYTVYDHVQHGSVPTDVYALRCSRGVSPIRLAQKKKEKNSTCPSHIARNVLVKGTSAKRQRSDCISVQIFDLISEHYLIAAIENNSEAGRGCLQVISILLFAQWLKTISLLKDLTKRQHFLLLTCLQTEMRMCNAAVRLGS